MSRHSPSYQQQGYALTEVLIAGVIAAGVLSATATAISTTVRTHRSIEENRTILEEARRIRAGISAGMPLNDVLSSTSGWDWSKEIRPQEGDLGPEHASLVTYEFVFGSKK
ncbi:MAG: hypothetical protein AAFY83_05775, partial [Pseudomonadota bacterium]